MGNYKDNVKKFNEAYSAMMTASRIHFNEGDESDVIKNYISIAGLLSRKKSWTEFNDDEKKKLKDYLKAVENAKVTVAKKITNKDFRDAFLMCSQNVINSLTEIINPPQVDAPKADQNDEAVTKMATDFVNEIKAFSDEVEKAQHESISKITEAASDLNKLLFDEEIKKVKVEDIKNNSKKVMRLFCQFIGNAKIYSNYTYGAFEDEIAKIQKDFYDINEKLALGFTKKETSKNINNIVEEFDNLEKSNDDPLGNLNQSMSEYDEKTEKNSQLEEDMHEKVLKKPELSSVKFMADHGKKLIELGRKQNWNSAEYNDFVFSVNVYAKERNKHVGDKKWELNTIKKINDRLHAYMNKVENRDHDSHNGVNSEKYLYCQEFESEFNVQFKDELEIIHNAEKKIEKQKEDKKAQIEKTNKEIHDTYGTFIIGY